MMTVHLDRLAIQYWLQILSVTQCSCQQLLDKECQVAVLETRVQGLEHQLQEALHQQVTTAKSLSDAQQALQEHQRLTVDKVWLLPLHSIAHSHCSAFYRYSSVGRRRSTCRESCLN